MTSVFERTEIKYLINESQHQKIINAIKPYMSIDKYGRTSIQSIYFDTSTYFLIRESIDKPTYKEKMRLRSYGLSNNKPVYLELKKKAYDTVYKRRICIKENDAISFINNEKSLPKGQIEKEITCFKNHYQDLKPSAMIIYERDSYYTSDQEFKITFDMNIRYRRNNFNLNSNLDGTTIIPDNSYLMEVKANGAIPLWFCKILSENKIYKNSFSKYGEAYKLFREEVQCF